MINWANQEVIYPFCIAHINSVEECEKAQTCLIFIYRERFNWYKWLRANDDQSVDYHRRKSRDQYIKESWKGVSDFFIIRSTLDSNHDHSTHPNWKTNMCWRKSFLIENRTKTRDYMEINGSFLSDHNFDTQQTVFFLNEYLKVMFTLKQNYKSK